MSEYSEAHRFASLRRKGSSERKPVTNEDNGTRAGYHVEHWDDRQDAVATPTELKMKVIREE